MWGLLDSPNFCCCLNWTERKKKKIPVKSILHNTTALIFCFSGGRGSQSKQRSHCRIVIVAKQGAEHNETQWSLDSVCTSWEWLLKKNRLSMSRLLTDVIFASSFNTSLPLIYLIFFLEITSFYLENGRWQRDAASCDALTQPLSFSREAQEVFGFHQELFILEYPAACSFLENKQVSQPDGKHVCRQTFGTVGSGGEEGNLPLLIVV